MTSIWLFSLAIPSRGSHGLGTHWDRPQLSILINPHLAGTRAGQSFPLLLLTGGTTAGQSFPCMAGTTAGHSFPLLVQQLASPFPCWYNSWPVLSLAGTTAGQSFPLLVQQLACSPFPCWYISWPVLSLVSCC